MNAVKINRLHAVYPSDVTQIQRVMMHTPDGWLVVGTSDGNTYQSELASKPDPECPVDPEELCAELVALTGIQPDVVP